MTTVTTLTPGSIEQFQNYLSVRGRSENTIRAYGSDLRALLTWVGGSVSHDSLEETTARWLNATRTEASPKTTQRRLGTARAYALWTGFDRFLYDYRPPTPQRSMPHPIPEGMNGVIRMCESAGNDQEAALFALQGMCGLRVSEARSVLPRNIDTIERTVTVRGKGDVTRTVPISDKAWKYIEPAYTRASLLGEPLVCLSDRGARYAITRMGERLGMQRPIASHDLRHTIATAMYAKTKDLRATQEMLGHASSTTTEIYTMVGMTAMREGMDF